MSEDPKEVIARAIEILKDKKVGENILKLISVGSYQIGDEDLVINGKAELPSSIKEELKVRGTDKSNLFRFDGISIQVIVANFESSSFPDGGMSGDVLIYADNECVLHNDIGGKYTEWGASYKLSFYDFSIKKLKLGVWIDQISRLVQRIEEIKKEREKKETEARLKNTASNIDLGDYDPNK